MKKIIMWVAIVGAGLWIYNSYQNKPKSPKLK